MIFERYFEVAAQGLHAIMTGAYPFASQFTYQLRILFEPVGQNATADAFTRFQQSHVPIFENLGGSLKLIVALGHSAFAPAGGPTRGGISDQLEEALKAKGHNVVVANAGSPIARVKTMAGLRPYKLGVTIGTTAYDYVNSFVKPSQKPNVYDSQTDAVSALNAKQIDGIVVDFPSTGYIVNVQLKNGVIVGRLPTRGTREHFGIVLPKDSPNVRCVNRALNRLWANGTIKALQNRWIAKGAPELR